MQKRKIKDKTLNSNTFYFLLFFKLSLLLKRVVSDMLFCITSMQINEKND